MLDRDRENSNQVDQLNNYLSELKQSAKYNSNNSIALLISIVSGITFFFVMERCLDNHGLLYGLLSILCFLVMFFSIFLFLSNLIKLIKQSISIKSTKKKIEEAKTNIDRLIKKRDDERPQINILIQGIDNDLTVVKQKLETAFSINIIPIPFRTPEGVFYLYDYLSSSDQSLSEALVQANLDSIKNQMQSVIENQSQSIVLQAQNNAQNEELIINQQAMLKSLSKTETYVQKIASVVSDADYYMKETLAYQRSIEARMNWI